MSTLYFVIRKENKFLRNVLSESKSKEYVPLESLTSYYYTCTKFLKNQYCYMSFDNISKFKEINGEDLLELCQNDCYEHDNFVEFLYETKKFDIKKINKKILKQTLLTLAFLYTHIIDFPVSDFSIQIFTCANAFENQYHIISAKIHWHHSHSTGKIHGYVH